MAIELTEGLSYSIVFNALSVSLKTLEGQKRVDRRALIDRPNAKNLKTLRIFNI